jgi:ketosteroid isomerase-like protein
MKRSILFILIAVLFAACGGTVVDNKAPNTNTGNSNTVKTGPAPPTKEALVAIERKAFEAWKNKDGKYFEGFLADNFVGFDGKGNRMGKAAAVKEITESKCEVKSSSLSDEQMTPVDADTAVLTLKATQDYTCDGKTGPPVAWGATVYTRSGDTWKAVYHNEIPVADPKAPPPTPAPVSAPAAKPADTRPAVDEKPTDPLTEGYLAAIKKGWEAWKNRDAKAFEDIVTKDMILIDPAGRRLDKAGAIQSWTEPKCAIKSYTLTDASGVSLSKTAGLLTLKGTADGSCESIGPIGAIWGTYVIVKDGDNWKAAMIFETPA